MYYTYKCKLQVSVRWRVPRREKTVAASDSISQASQLLFQMGRVFGRLASASDSSKQGANISQIHVLLAVESLRNEAQDATVGRVAIRMGIDPSTASRLVMQTLEAQLLRRAVSQRDGRAVILEMTKEGEQLAFDARAYQRSVFDDLTQDWPEIDRNDFARLFVRFSQAFIDRQNLKN